MVPFISVTGCHGALACRPLESVPPCLPNVVTTPMLRVDTIVVEPRTSTKIVRPPAMTAIRNALQPAGRILRRRADQHGDHGDDHEHRYEHLKALGSSLSRGQRPIGR